jgi:hypothetical protein
MRAALGKASVVIVSSFTGRITNSRAAFSHLKPRELMTDPSNTSWKSGERNPRNEMLGSVLSKIRE